MKTCTKCLSELDLSFFYKSNRGKDGFMSWCKSCESERSRIKNQANKERRLLKAKEWRENNREVRDAGVKRWRKENPERTRQTYRNWRHANKHKANESWMRRYADKKNRTPSWLTEEHLSQIKEQYWLAADLRAVTGEDYHVDHIVPLHGKTVSGLHVPWNLQILPADVNRPKSNKMTALTEIDALKTRITTLENNRWISLTHGQFQ